MTLSQLLANADSRELTLWRALYDMEAEQRSNDALAAKAEAALRTARR